MRDTITLDLINMKVISERKKVDVLPPMFHFFALENASCPSFPVYSRRNFSALMDRCVAAYAVQFTFLFGEWHWAF